MNTVNIKKLELNLMSDQLIFNREPFKYIVLDDFLNIESAEDIWKEYPKITDEWKDARGLHTQNKWALPLIEDGIAGEFMQEINSKEFIKYLFKLTNIPDLLPDPELSGAGYHQMTNGGFLDVHVDFNRLEGSSIMDRRLNLLVYFNKNWRQENGGYLELWDMEKKIMLEKICPKFNRCVIFETNEISYHGHPKPLNIGPCESRKSLSAYFYTKGRGDIDFVESHNTLYVNTESARGSVKIFFNGLRHLYRKLRDTL